MKSLLSVTQKQFFAHRRHFLLPLLFCSFSVIVYAVPAYCGVHFNIPDKVSGKFLICVWFTSPLLISRRLPEKIRSATGKSTAFTDKDARNVVFPPSRPGEKQ